MGEYWDEIDFTVKVIMGAAVLAGTGVLAFLVVGLWLLTRW